MHNIDGVRYNRKENETWCNNNSENEDFLKIDLIDRKINILQHIIV